MVGNAKVTIVAELYADSGSSSSGGGMNMNMGGSSATSSSTPEKPMQTMTLDMMPAQQAGQYQGELTLDQPGHWMLTVNSLINNQPASVEFTQEISKGGPNMLVISIFAIVIVGIIAAAAITRRRSAKKAVAEGAK
jgi:predicted pyridoxine 5'-phosphate oxidase superfamily flavin-nucleotide-binding protein